MQLLQSRALPLGYPATGTIKLILFHTRIKLSFALDNFSILKGFAGLKASSASAANQRRLPASKNAINSTAMPVSISSPIIPVLAFLMLQFSFSNFVGLTDYDTNARQRGMDLRCFVELERAFACSKQRSGEGEVAVTDSHDDS